MSRGIYGGAITPVTIFDSDNNQLGTLNSPFFVYVEPVVSSPNDVSAPVANTAAVVTYAAVAGYHHVISGVAWSYYGGIPTGGQLTITDAGVTVFQLDIAEEGPGFFVFPRPKSCRNDSPLVVTLAAGGVAVTGKVSVINHWEEAA